MSAQAPLTVSIAMCTYNGARFLPEQLSCLANQSRLPDEVIICDDCSSDNTVDILNDWAKSVPFSVKIVQNEKNLGYAQNFAKAISRYYEWRRALMGRIKADLDRENASGRAQWILKYDVPYEYNHFETDEDGAKRALKERQNESYVEIEAWR